MVEKAAEEGLPVVIFRPGKYYPYLQKQMLLTVSYIGMVSAHSETGAANLLDTDARFYLGVLQVTNHHFFYPPPPTTFSRL